MAQHAKDKDVSYDNQRRKIEKLMENPDRLMDLPETSMSVRGKNYEPPDFVRNVMGSSAGAGSGEFHVYRHLRRKEMTRLKELEEGALAEDLDKEYKAKLEELKRKSEELTRRKKEKRSKKKEKTKQKRNQRQAKQQQQHAANQSEPQDDRQEKEQQRQWCGRNSTRRKTITTTIESDWCGRISVTPVATAVDSPDREP